MLKEKALVLLELIATKDKEYDVVNDMLTKIQGDFPTHVNYCDMAIEDKLVRLLNDILGDDIASYFLYEARGMPNGGMIVEDGIEYPIKTIEDVMAYVNRTREGEKPL